TGLSVAIKILNSNSINAKRLAEKEVKIASRLKHPNLLRIFGAFEAGEFTIVVMELVYGHDLADRRVNDVDTILIGLSDAISEMSMAKIVHRDVKPANIMLRADNSPVLVDFGLAVELDLNATIPSLGGTPLFMPPEAFDAEW